MVYIGLIIGLLLVYIGLIIGLLLVYIGLIIGLFLVYIGCRAVLVQGSSGFRICKVGDYPLGP